MKTQSEYLSIIEQTLKSTDYPASPRELYAPIAYTLDGGGKRLRPMLAMVVCDGYGADSSKMVNQALAIEMFHNFTLLHDDVMDRADMRRGRPTVHVRWSDRQAILSGDAMLTMANIMVRRQCTAQQAIEAAQLLDRTAMQVYEGQQFDMDFENRADVSVADYLEMIRLKTSVLIGCACEMGALMAGQDQRQRDALFDFGVKLGMAFQLQDDYLDTYGDPIIFGKEIGGDILNDKKTWLSITALAEDTTGTLLQEMREPSNETQKVARVRQVYDRLDLDRRCHQLIDQYVDEAIAVLDDTSLSPQARQFLTTLAEHSRTRTH